MPSRFSLRFLTATGLVLFGLAAAQSAEVTNVYDFAGANATLISPNYITGAHVYQGSGGHSCSWYAWQAGYGNIGGATYASAPSAYQRISVPCPLKIRPIPGYEMAFNSFKLGIYPAPRPDDVLTTFEWGYENEPRLFQQSTQTVVPGGQSHYHASVNSPLSPKAFEVVWYGQQEGAWNMGLGQFSITTLTTVAIRQAFAPAIIRTGQQSTFTLTLSTSDSRVGAQTGINLSETLPSGMTVASAPNPNQCGGTVSAGTGGNTIAFTGGSLAAHPSSCTISVPVTAPAGSYTNTTANLAHNTTNSLTGPWTFDETNLGSATLTVAPIRVAGRVFEDVQADLLADGSVGGSGNPGIPGRTVRLFNSAGTQVGTDETDASGAYSFSLDAAGTYYVVADAPTMTAAGTSGVLAEQTYASAGSGNVVQAGGVSGYGPICVSSDGSYTQRADPPISAPAGNSANGACYGGRRGTVADSGTTALASREHVVRIVANGDDEITGVDFGFSFNVVTNANDAGQGSLRQFIANANAITAASGGGGEPNSGANAMRFVPAVARNGSGDWWQVAPASALPALSAPGTAIDGMAYRNDDGTTALARSSIGTGGRVGADWNDVALAQIPVPQLAIANGLASDALSVTAGANDTIIRNIGIFGTSANSGSGISASGGLTGLRIESNVIGVLPQAGTPSGSVAHGIYLRDNSNGSFTVANNYIGGTRDYGGILASNNTHSEGGRYIISGNEIVDTLQDGMNLSGSSHVTVRGNLLLRFAQTGVDLVLNGGNNIVEHNTVSHGRGLYPEASAVRLVGDASSNRNNIVRFNKLTDNSGSRHAGIAQTRFGTGNRFSRNQFGGNAGNAIDNIDHETSSLPDGVTVSTGCTVNSVPLGRPVLASAVLVDGKLKLTGSYCETGTYTLEVYKVAPGDAGDIGADGLQAGEGGLFLDEITGLSGGALSAVLDIAPGQLAAGTDHVTAILIRESAVGGGAGDTSEFSANAAVVSVPFITIATVTEGRVGAFTFTGANGFPADGTYAVETTAEGEPGQGHEVALAAPDVATEIAEEVPAGWQLAKAVCEDRNAAVTGNPPGEQIGHVSDGRTLVIPAGNARPGADLLCTFTNRHVGFSLTGRVILDNGAGTGTAHDGVPNGAETGLGGAMLRLTDCGSIDYARGTTDGAGYFTLSLIAAPAEEVCVVREEVSGHVGVSGHASDTDGHLSAAYERLAFTVQPDTDYSAVVFGLIALPTLTRDMSAAVAPGGLALLPHRYIATTTASVAFELLAESGEPGPFSATLYRDDDCSGTLEPGDTEIPGPIDVTAGEEICLVVRVEAAAGVPAGMEHVHEIVATTTIEGTSLSPAVNRDVVTVAAAGSITLVKRVRNITSGGDSAPFITSGTGSPGDVLEYAITFTNPSKGAVSNVQVFDETPPYTHLAVPPGPTVTEQPAGMECRTAMPADGEGDGYTGNLQWTCTGAMPPGGKGEVRFRVRIDS